ncbi:hypothetical protein DYB32_005582 [Aphanomyces invadans]|uniref:PH domain-containing protein n=1 Tax=Aphanomyces invadans TaxID=157072 RepID=A0A3R7A829_9STRA|nr:hypothetical protein DYB32_005582 [Aphanomyces invadans]
MPTNGHHHHVMLKPTCRCCTFFMNQKELLRVRRAFNARYVHKREWPLRIDKPRVVPLPKPIVDPSNMAAPSPSPPPSPMGKATFENVSFVLRDAINDGFPFTLDRIGNGMAVMLGSFLVAINGHTVRLTDDVEAIMHSRDPNLTSLDQKDEAMRLQMINLFKAHGVSAKPSTACVATFVQTPSKVDAVHKWNPRSKYKPWSLVYLKLQCGYLNFYSTEAKASNATVEDMRDSAVVVNVMHCTARPDEQQREFTFQVIETLPSPIDHDEGDAPIEDKTSSTVDSNEQDRDLDADLLDDVHAFLGSTSVVQKVVVEKEPRLYRFRVETAAARASWLRHIHAAQNFCAEDFYQP